MQSRRREQRTRDLQERITRLEQELGIGWLSIPGFGQVREGTRFELPCGKIIPVEEIAEAGGFSLGVASCCGERHILGRDCQGDPR